MSEIIIVVPTYNEVENISRLITEVAHTLSGIDYKFLIIDDNSPDNTASFAELSGHGRVVVDRRPGRDGIGSALSEGLRLALAEKDCQFVVTMDADLSHQPKDLRKLIESCQTADVVQGSRYVPGGRIVGWSLSRRIMSRLANLLCQVLAGSRTHENTTNFRVYSRRAAGVVARQCSEPGYEWVVEAVLVAQRKGLSVVEIPITFTDRIAGESKLQWTDLRRWWHFVWRTSLKRIKQSETTRYMPRFLGIGILGVFVNLGVLWFLRQLNFPLLLAGAIAIEISLLVNFLGNDLWTFRNRRSFSRLPLLSRVRNHHAVYAVGMVLNLVALWVLTSTTQVQYLAANAAGIAAAAAWNLKSSVYWIWPSSRGVAPTPDDLIEDTSRLA